MTDYRVGIVDIGMGNLRSVANAVYENGYDPEMIQYPQDLADLPRLILPGVGSFRAASDCLIQGGWISAIQRFVQSAKPLMGICLGMQLLATAGDEGGGSPGLDLIPGTVRHLPQCGLRIPHVGWNSVELNAEHPLFADIKPDRDFYFVHSYQFEVDDPSHRLAVTDYAEPVTAVVARDNIIGVQFHPEKSQRNGLALLEAFLDWDGASEWS